MVFARYQLPNLSSRECGDAGDYENWSETLFSLNLRILSGDSHVIRSSRSLWGLSCDKAIVERLTVEGRTTLAYTLFSRLGRSRINHL